MIIANPQSAFVLFSVMVCYFAKYIYKVVWKK
jgi:hypothetical protein